MIRKRKNCQLFGFSKYLPIQRGMYIQIRKAQRRSQGKTTRNLRTIAYTHGEWMVILGASKQFKKLVGLDM